MTLKKGNVYACFNVFYIPRLGTSDHNCVHLNNIIHHCGTSKPNQKKSQRTIWIEQQADFNGANDLLKKVN